MTHHLFRFPAKGPQGSNTTGLVSLGKFHPAIRQEQGHMVVNGRWLTEHCGHSLMRRTSRDQIVSAHHIRDAKGEFIHHRGQVISHKTIRTAHDRITAG